MSNEITGLFSAGYIQIGMPLSLGQAALTTTCADNQIRAPQTSYFTNGIQDEVSTVNYTTNVPISMKRDNLYIRINTVYRTRS